MYDFFISHSSKDKEKIVDELAHDISKKGYTVWYDAEQINLGDNINEEIDLGLKRSICLILIITKNFFKSKWVFFEFGKYSAYQKARIIPIIYDISSDEYLQIIQILGNTKFINAKQKSTLEVTNALLQALDVAKAKNESLLIKDELYKLYKNIKSHEDINSGIVCMLLTEYFDIMDNHPAYIVICAQKVVANIANESIRRLLKNVEGPNRINDFPWLIEMLRKCASKNLVEYVSFVLKANAFEESSSQIDLINNALLFILRWYYSIKYRIKNTLFTFDIIYPGEMLHSDFDETDEIDYLVLREDLIASVETAIEWYDYNNYTYIAIREPGKKIAGYITLLPITDDTYNQILSGDFMDKEFTKESILLYEAPGLYTVYVASVAIHPKYQNSNAFLELYNAAIDMFLELAEQRDIFIEKIIAEASTQQGEKLCKLLKMSKYGSTTSNTDVYTLTLIPPEFRLFGDKGRIFMNLCKQKYEEYREYFQKQG